MLYSKKLANFVKKSDISMLTGLKVSILACKWVFYRTEYDAKRGPLGTEF